MAMELFAKTYTQLYDINCIGLRFFTVYGPRGRPDMAPYKFLKAISEGTKFKKFGEKISRYLTVSIRVHKITVRVAAELAHVQLHM